MLNGQFWIQSGRTVIGALGPVGGFKGAVNFTKLNSKLYVYECMHIFLRGSVAVKLHNQKKKDTKKKDAICYFTSTKFSQRVRYLL